MGPEVASAACNKTLLARAKPTARTIPSHAKSICLRWVHSKRDVAVRTSIVRGTFLNDRLHLIIERPLHDGVSNRALPFACQETAHPRSCCSDIHSTILGICRPSCAMCQRCWKLWVERSPPLKAEDWLACCKGDYLDVIYAAHEQGIL